MTNRDSALLDCSDLMGNAQNDESGPHFSYQNSELDNMDNDYQGSSDIGKLRLNAQSEVMMAGGNDTTVKTDTDFNPYANQSIFEANVQKVNIDSTS